MTENLPVIYWCWPEALSSSPTILNVLDSFGKVTTSEISPGSNETVEILVPRLTHEVDSSLMQRLPTLRIIATPSTGTDHIDLEEARRRNIQVVSLRYDRAFLDSLQSTAELTWLLLLACVRRFRTANEHAMDGHWSPMSVRGNELIGKTVGIVGLGRLGTMVARIAIAFQMRVLGCDIRTVDVDGVQQVDLKELLRESDVVSVHVHLDDSTRGLIGREEFELMKRGAVLVNTSRGAVLDESALLDALKSGHLAGAGLDVLTGERTADFPSHPLIQYARDHDHLILTPHVGGCTLEAQDKAFVHTAYKIRDVWNSLIQQDVK
jgi:D-3-phosphoglycerate dehydrogenase / 2-oxoglutarate reductase